MPHDNSHSFLGRPYHRGSGTLQIGDQVKVHPITDAHAATYDASIILHKDKVCLDVPDGVFNAPITQKLFERLEKV